MYSFEAAVWLCKLFLEKEDAVLCLCNRVYQDNSRRYAWAKQEQIRWNQGAKADEIEFLKSVFSSARHREALESAIQDLRKEERTEEKKKNSFQDIIKFNPEIARRKESELENDPEVLQLASTIRNYKEENEAEIAAPIHFRRSSISQNVSGLQLEPFKSPKFKRSPESQQQDKEPEQKVAIFEDYAAKKKKLVFSFKKKKEKVTDTLSKIHGVLEPRFIQEVHSKVKDIKTQKRQTSRPRSSSKKKLSPAQEIKELFASSPFIDETIPSFSRLQQVSLNCLDGGGGTLSARPSSASHAAVRRPATASASRRPASPSQLSPTISGRPSVMLGTMTSPSFLSLRSKGPSLSPSELLHETQKIQPLRKILSEQKSMKKIKERIEEMEGREITFQKQMLKQKEKERIHFPEADIMEADEAQEMARLKINMNYWQNESEMKETIRRHFEQERDKFEKERNLREHKKFQKEMQKKELSLKIRQSVTARGTLHNVQEEMLDTEDSLTTFHFGEIMRMRSSVDSTRMQNGMERMQRKNIRKIESYMYECQNEIKEIDKKMQESFKRVRGSSRGGWRASPPLSP